MNLIRFASKCGRTDIGQDKAPLDCVTDSCDYLEANSDASYYLSLVRSSGGGLLALPAAEKVDRVIGHGFSCLHRELLPYLTQLSSSFSKSIAVTLP